MDTKIFLTAVFCCFIAFGCASYSDQMRATNDMHFLFQCEEADPNAGMQDISACVNTLHDQKEKEVIDKKNQSRWTNIFGGILGFVGAGVAVNESFNRKDTAFSYQTPYFFNPPTLFNQPPINYNQPSNNYVQPGNNYLQPANCFSSSVNGMIPISCNRN